MCDTADPCLLFEILLPKRQAVTHGVQQDIECGLPDHFTTLFRAGFRHYYVLSSGHKTYLALFRQHTGSLHWSTLSDIAFGRFWPLFRESPHLWFACLCVLGSSVPSDLEERFPNLQLHFADHNAHFINLPLQNRQQALSIDLGYFLKEYSRALQEKDWDPRIHQGSWGIRSFVDQPIRDQKEAS